MSDESDTANEMEIGECGTQGEWVTFRDAELGTVRYIQCPDEEIAKRVADALNATRPLTNEEEARRGELAAKVFLLRKDIDHPARYRLGEGYLYKTPLGVIRVMRRIVQEGE